ncbi:MAG: carbon storage regulator [Peptoclostridium sp.]|uniref:carbon storage regulator n=1 Tax=Peptoclostridium sp. TaxID=1904860 RepID=UPI00139AF60A|nr:carbon storage regulator [Peptoclostridium sp.]MZQ75866.1 carbon storage regulator [Peptoclostridium sp.]
MLVLGRKPGEYVMIGDHIKVQVVKSENGNLRLAIDAPREYPITRGEIYEESLEKKQAMACV